MSGSWIGVAVIGGVLGCLVLPAAGHWEYTRWGMSVDQVRAATRGATTDNADRELDGYDFKTLLLAPHAWGTIQLRADFRFDNASGKLNSVGLRPLESGDCDPIRAELTKRYGKAQPDAPLIAKWQTRDKDVVTFSRIGTCRLDYIPPTYPKVP